MSGVQQRNPVTRARPAVSYHVPADGRMYGSYRRKLAHSSASLYVPPPPRFAIFLEVNPASSSRWRRQRPRAVPSAAPVVMNDCAVLGIRLDQCNPAAAAYAAAGNSQIQQAGELLLLQRPDGTGGGADAQEHVGTLSGVGRPLHTR